MFIFQSEDCILKILKNKIYNIIELIYNIIILEYNIRRVNSFIYL